MRVVRLFLKSLALGALFSISYFTRVREVMVEEGDGSFDLRSGNLVAGTLEILFIPAFIISLMALYSALRKVPSRWTVRYSRYLAFALTLSAHLLAFHIGQWNAVFNPAAILADRSEDLTMRVISSGIALFFLAATLTTLFSFLNYGKRRRRGGTFRAPESFPD